MQQDHESEIEDLMNPKDELNKKIVNLADTIRKWNEESVKVRKTVREQLEEIANLGLNKYHMERTDLRRLVEKIFRIHGVSDSWLRKLLPVELKDSSKIRISYLQRQEIEKERQRLLQQQASESQQEPDQASSPIPLDSHDKLVSKEYTSADFAFKTSEPQEYAELMPGNHTRIEYTTTHDRLLEPNQDIERLKEDVRRLSEQFVAIAYLQTAEQDIPLIVHIDPVRKVIISIRIQDTHI